MAFKLENFRSDIVNVKNIFGGVSYFRYYNEAGDTVTTEGFLPTSLGIKNGDRVTVIPATLTSADVNYYADVDATTGAITLTAFA